MKKQICQVLLVIVTLVSANTLFGDFWSPITTVSSAASVASLNVAMNSNGDSIAIWSEGNNIYSSLLPYSATSWETPIQVFAGGADTIGLMSIALDDSGNAAAVWINVTTGQQQASYFTSGGSWGTPAGFTVTTNTLPVIFMDSNGTPASLVNANGSLQVITYLSGSWQSTVVATDNLNAYAAGLIGSSNGDLVAIWPAEFLGTLQYSSRHNGVWSAPITITMTGQFNATPLANRPILGDSSDNSRIIFVIPASVGFGPVNPTIWGFVSATTDPQLATSWQQNNFFPESNVTGAPSPTYNYPIFADTGIDGSGNATLFWANSSSWTLGGPVYAAFLPAASSSWSSVVEVSSQNAINVGIAVDTQSRALGVWNNTTAPSTIQFAYSTLGGAWTSSEQLSSTGVAATLPRIATSTSMGNSVVVWVEAASNLVQSRFTPVTVSPVLNLSGSSRIDRFATQGDLIYTISWQASTSSGVSMYNIYSDAALTQLIATISASDSLTAQFHNNNPKIATTYYVVAITGTGLQSAATSFTFSASN